MFRISNAEKLASDIREILVLSDEQLSSLALSLNNDDSKILSRADLRKHLQTQLTGEHELLGQVLESFLIKTAKLVSDVVSKDSQFSASLIKDVIEREFEASKNNDLVERFLATWPTLEAMMCSDVVRLVEKSIRLTFDQSDILTDARIITDIRPVYDDDREIIERALIVQTMRIDYYNSGRKKTLSLALDNADLMRLKECVEKAMSKAVSAKALIETEAKISVLLPGESNNGESE
ncbi:hypothetical protein IMCC3135_04870 [Granulosicoccus antarcticus IMCC3135]|uniref:Uncharacterized protein n=2 Tax=Granulosicoccus TaxID=437504 RepID=A0A2Z2NTX7_9GAMM|nr:hypothetical protein IMCC3135_04870 [Granulosicoccus antarcticus IMCC3135]